MAAGDNQLLGELDCQAHRSARASMSMSASVLKRSIRPRRRSLTRGRSTELALLSFQVLNNQLLHLTGTLTSNAPLSIYDFPLKVRF